VANRIWDGFRKAAGKIPSDAVPVTQSPSVGTGEASTPFLRIWDATYLVDPAGPTHTGRCVSGLTRDEVMAEAFRRTPAGGRLVYVSQHHEGFDEIWTEEAGFTPHADRRCEYPDIRRFKDLEVGEYFNRGEMTFEKVDDRHARNIDAGNVFEIDPYDDHV